MARLSTLLVLLTLSLSSFAQMSVSIEDTSICSDQSIWIVASGMDSYEWRGDSMYLDSTDVDSVNFSTSVPATYTIKVIGYTVLPLDSDSVTYTIVVNPTPTVSIASSAGDSICEGAGTELSATTGFVSYTWTPAATLDTTLLDTVTASAVNTTTTYYVTVEDSLGCMGTDSFMLHVNPNPVVSIISSAGNSICEGSSTELVVDSGYSSYMWTPGATLDTTTIDTVIATPVDSITTYMVMVVDSHGCSGSDSVVVMTVPSPEVEITSILGAPQNYLCLGDDVTLTAEADNIASYEWSPTSSLNDSTSMSVVASPLDDTDYSVIVTDPSGCTGSATISITVNPTPPTLTINVANDTICIGSSTLINLQSNGTGFAWSPGSTLDDPTSRDVIATPATTTTYTVTVTRNGCTATGSTTITVLAAPVMSSSQSSGGQAICLDETDEITIDCSDCVTYTWKFPNSSLNTSNNVQVVSPNEPGAIEIIVSGYDVIGCKGDESVIVNVDSCFVGTPWSPEGIDEEAEVELQVLTRTDEIEFVSPSTIESMRLFNLLGEEVLVLQGNSSSMSFRTTEMSEGVYIARILAGGEDLIKKIYLK